MRAGFQLVARPVGQDHLRGGAEELGHAVYRQREGMTGLDGEIERLVGEMKALHAEINAIPS